MSTDSIARLQELVGTGREAIERYLDDYESGKQELQLNWPLLFDVAARNARRDTDLQWASIAIRAVNLIGKDHAYWEPWLEKSMSLRASLIASMGTRVGDPILDGKIVLQWFDDELKLSLVDAKEKIERWEQSTVPLFQRLPIDDLKELRHTKQRLSVIRKLADCGQIPRDSHLNDWLAIQAQLP
jgi:hypothetical protein